MFWFCYLSLFLGETVVGGWVPADSAPLGLIRLVLQPSAAGCLKHFLGAQLRLLTSWRCPRKRVPLEGTFRCGILFHKPASVAVCIDFPLCYGLPTASASACSGSPLSPHLPSPEWLGHGILPLLHFFFFNQKQDSTSRGGILCRTLERGQSSRLHGFVCC